MTATSGPTMVRDDASEAIASILAKQQKAADRSKPGVPVIEKEAEEESLKAGDADAEARAAKAEAMAAAMADRAAQAEAEAAKAAAMARAAAGAHMSPITRRWMAMPSYESLREVPAVVRVLHEAERGKAHAAQTKAEQLRNVYKSAHRPGPVTAEGRAAFEKVEAAYQELLKLTNNTDLEANATSRFAGLYKYVHEKAKPIELTERFARKREAQKIEHARMLAAIPPELKTLVEMMHGRWTEKVSTEQINAAAAKLSGPQEQAVALIVEHFNNSGHLAFQHRAIPALEAIGGSNATEALLDIALKRTGRTHPRTFAEKAGRSYLALVKERADIYRLLASDDEGVLWHAMSALRGGPVDDTLLQTLAKLLQSKSLSSRLIATDVLADAPTPDHAEGKLQLVLGSIATAREIDNPDRPGHHGSHTEVERLYYHFINGLKRMQGIGELLSKAEADATGLTQICVVLARGERGDQAARTGVLKVLVTPEAGLLRARAALALEQIGRVEDLPVLRKVAETDPLSREQTHRVPGEDETFFPVREAARRTILAIEARSPAESDEPTATPAAAHGIPRQIGRSRQSGR
jgi:hypothetical protein